MIKFKLFTLSNPCPVCSDAKGNCRYNSEDVNFIQCHGFSDARRFEKVNGFVCVKQQNNGHTASFKPDNSQEWTEEKRREWEDLKVARQQAAKEHEQLKQQRALSVNDRHRLYSQILSELSINADTLADLKKRGFSQAEIDACGFKSVVRNQKLQGRVDNRLPGIERGGRSLLTSGDGYCCPLYDFEGRIVALQLRLHNPPDGNRYRWISSQQQTLALYPEAENPLTVLRSTDKPEGIALAEGVGAKPLLLAHRFNKLVIGSAGGQWASSPKLLERYLEQAYQLVGGEKIITLYPDAGDVCNENVVSRWKKVTNLLISWGWQVRFAWWGQVNKTFSDIDELKPEELDWIRYLTIAEFKALCIKWGGLIPSGTGFNPTPIDYQQRVAEAQKKLHNLSYAVDLLCDSSQKYLPDLVGRIPTKGITLLNAAKGSGKSHQIKAIKRHCCGYWSENITYPEVPELPPEQLDLLVARKKLLASPEPLVEKVWNKGLGMKFVSVNARIALGRGQAILWEFTWIEDTDFEGSEEFGGLKLATESVLENISELGLCADSLAKLKNRDWSNTLIVIDEIELVLNHISTSSTCRDKRSEILQVLEDKIKESLDNGGMLIGADADLTDVTCDYLKALAPNHPPFIVKHDFKGDPWEIDYYTGKRDMVLSQIEEHLADPECEPIALAVDNQKEAESLSIHLTRKYPYLAREIGGLIRIDSKVTQQDYGKEFVKRTNESIKKYQPNVLIYSPSLGVGCSIDLKYFRRVFGLFFGNLEPSQCRQMLARVRESVPRTVWAKIRAGNSEDEATSYLPEDIKKRLFNYHDTAMIPLEQALAKARAEVEASGIDNPEDKDLLPLLIQTLKNMQGIDGSWNNPHVDLFCKQQARRNFGLSQLAVQLRQELIEEGHHVIDEEGDQKTQAGDAVREGKEEIKRHNSNLISNAEDIEFKEAQELKRKAARSVEDEHKISKAFLRNDLPDLELTPDFVYKATQKDNGRWLNQAKLFWFMNNRDALANKDEKNWRLKLSQFSKGVTCLWDVRIDTPKVEAIIKSGLFDWIKLDDFEAKYSSESEAGQAFLKRTLANKKQLRNALGITVHQDSSPVKVANRILDRLGLKLAYSTRTEATKYYKLDKELVMDSDRQAVFEALNLKWENEKQQIAQNRQAARVSRMTNENNYLINNEARSSNNKLEELPQNPVVEHTTEECLKPVAIEDVEVEKPIIEAKPQSQVTALWQGLQLRLKQVIDVAGLPASWKSAYENASDKLSGFQLTGHSEPFASGNKAVPWMVWVNTPLGCKSLPCDWLQLA